MVVVVVVVVLAPVVVAVTVAGATIGGGGPGIGDGDGMVPCLYTIKQEQNIEPNSVYVSMDTWIFQMHKNNTIFVTGFLQLARHVDNHLTHEQAGYT